MRKNFKDVGFYPQPVLIIGTYDADGVPDAMNVGWGGAAMWRSTFPRAIRPRKTSP